jgi:hypothetical protein
MRSKPCTRKGVTRVFLFSHFETNFSGRPPPHYKIRTAGGSVSENKRVSNVVILSDFFDPGEVACQTGVRSQEPANSGQQAGGRSHPPPHHSAFPTHSSEFQVQSSTRFVGIVSNAMRSALCEILSAFPVRKVPRSAFRVPRWEARLAGASPLPAFRLLTPDFWGSEALISEALPFPLTVYRLPLISLILDFPDSLAVLHLFPSSCFCTNVPLYHPSRPRTRRFLFTEFEAQF